MIVRRLHDFIVLSGFIIVNCVAFDEMTHEDHSHHRNDKTECGTPAYILYILGFISLLLLLVSIFLIYVLIKTKFLHTFNVCYKNKYKPAPEQLEEGSGPSQKWENKSLRRPYLGEGNSKFKKRNGNDKILTRQDSAITIASDFNTLRSLKKTESSGSNVSPRTIKKVVKDMPIILPEQMSLICKEVLKRTKPEDLKGSLQNIDQLVKEGSPVIEVDIKYASTPALDLYDVLPTPRSDKKINTEKSESPDLKDTHSSKKPMDDKSESNCDAYDFPKELNRNALEVSDIYDLPKESSSKTEVQSGYVVPYFPTTELSNKFKKIEEKPKYALLKEPAEQISTTNKEDAKKTEATKSDVMSVYEFPKNSYSETKMYINANDNLFTC